MSPGNICQVLITCLKPLVITVNITEWVNRSKFLCVIMMEWNGVSCLRMQCAHVQLTNNKSVIITFGFASTKSHWDFSPRFVYTTFNSQLFTSAWRLLFVVLSEDSFCCWWRSDEVTRAFDRREYMLISLSESQHSTRALLYYAYALILFLCEIYIFLLCYSVIRTQCTWLPCSPWVSATKTDYV